MSPLLKSPGLIPILPATRSTEEEIPHEINDVTKVPRIDKPVNSSKPSEIDETADSILPQESDKLKKTRPSPATARGKKVPAPVKSKAEQPSDETETKRRKKAKSDDIVSKPLTAINHTKSATAPTAAKFAHIVLSGLTPRWGIILCGVCC